MLIVGLGAAGTACATGASTVSDTRIPVSEAGAPDAQPTRTLAPVGTNHGSTPPGTATRTQLDGSSLAVIESLTMPPRITCHGSVDVEVLATYATTGASAVIFLVDGHPAGSANALSPAGTTKTSGPATSKSPVSSPHADAPTSGTFAVALPCDGDAHTVVLTAVDAQGRTTVTSRAILTDTKPTGD